MRVLVACADCARQYEAGDLAVGDSFHCACGTTLEVPPPKAHEAAVVRCSACGAARREGAASCPFCSADFTLHEQDLHTVCPSCLARISDRARFCHHCGQPIVPAAAAGEPSDSPCPECGDRRRLRARRLGVPAVPVLECAGCAGLWITTEAFQLLRGRAQDAAAGRASEVPAQDRAPAPGVETPRYRPCPACGKLMHRANYGRRSGVIVDSCRTHGIWFDAAELDTVLRWIRSGAEADARRLEVEEERAALRRERLRRSMEPTEPDLSPGRGRLPFDIGDLLGRLLDL